MRTTPPSQFRRLITPTILVLTSLWLSSVALAQQPSPAPQNSRPLAQLSLNSNQPAVLSNPFAVSKSNPATTSTIPAAPKAVSHWNDSGTSRKLFDATFALPLFFEANQGQTDPKVGFLTRSTGYTLFLSASETTFIESNNAAGGYPKPLSSPLPHSTAGQAVLRMKLFGANPSPVLGGEGMLPGKVNYLIGRDPSRWHTGIPIYSEVRSQQVYPGIDLVFHGNERQLEYDFVVAPGADPKRVVFQITGADRIQLDPRGDLLLSTGKTEFRMRKPVIYQQTGAVRRAVDGGFSIKNNLVAFKVASYDKNLPLIIDPSIIFSTFLGGTGEELPSGLDLDTTNPSAPTLYVVGASGSITTFSETSTLIGTSPGAANYSFIAKIDPTKTGAASLDFLTFLGGSVVFSGGTGPCENLAEYMKLDVSGGAGAVEPVIVGQTNCQDFPVTSGGPTAATDDIFLTRLTPSGASLDNSIFFGGNGSAGLSNGSGVSIVVNPEGVIAMSGSTSSTNLPTTSGAYAVSFNNGTAGIFNDCFVAEFTRSFAIQYLTYLNVGTGTTSSSQAGCGVRGLDAAGKIYAGGNTFSSTAFNLANGGTGANGFQKTFAGTPGTNENGFLVLLDPSQVGLNQLAYSTYVGGGGPTAIQDADVNIATGLVVATGITFANGTTAAPNIPLANAFQSTNTATSGTGFITIGDSTKTGAASLVASTYFGGNSTVSSNAVYAVAFDPQPGNSPTLRVIVGGQTTASNFPTLNPLQASLVGSQNAFVSLFTVPNSGVSYNMALLFSTYIGGGVTASGESDSIRGLIADPNHNIYAIGRTVSSSFFGNTTPATTVNGFQAACASCGGGTPSSDLTIFELSPQNGAIVPDLTVTKTHTGNFAQGQTGAQYIITVTNSGTGPTIGTVSLTDSLPPGLTATAMSGTGWTCSTVTLTCTRSDTLASATSYQVITLTVSVSSSAPPSVTNTVVVSGGSETNTANDTASDVTTITSTVGACTNNFVGASGGSWGTAANWSGGIPVATDVACIPSGITVLLNTGLAVANQTISALNSSGTLTFSAGPLTVTNNSLANILNINGGTLVVNGQFTISGAFALSAGTFGGTGEFDLNGLFTWSGGTMCSVVTASSCVAGTNAATNARGGITFPPSANDALNYRNLNNYGTALWAAGAGGNLYLYNGSVITNPVGSTWNFQNDGTLNSGGTAGSFNNGGIFEKTNGTVTTTINVLFNNTGTVNENTGTMLFNGGGNCGSYCSGVFTAGTGGTISFQGGVFMQSGPINGTGTLNFSGATMDFGTGTETISTTNVKFSGGYLAGAFPGVVNFTTMLNWSGGTMCSSITVTTCLAGTNATTNFAAGIMFPPSASVALNYRTLNNNATVLWAAGAVGNMFVYNGSVVNNQVGSIWNFQNDSNVSSGGISGAFNNKGLFEKTGGTTTSTINLPFNNTGTVTGSIATLQFDAGGNCGLICSGTYTAGPAGTINFSAGVYSQDGPINGTGTVNFNGATMDFGTGAATVSTTTVNFSNGYLAGAAPGVLTFTTQLNWSGGTMCSSISVTTCLAGANATTVVAGGITFPPAANVAMNYRTLNNNGTVLWLPGAAGNLYLYNGSVINNQSAGVWNYQSDSNLIPGGTAGAFINAGLFEKTGGSTATSIAVLFSNTSGTVAANTATLLFDGGDSCTTACTGSWTAATGATLEFDGGIFNPSGPFSGAGTVAFTGGTVNLAGSFGVTGPTNINGGTANFIQTSAVTIPGPVNLSGGILSGPATVNLSGLLSWTGGEMCAVAACNAAGPGVTTANGGIAGSGNYLYLLGRALNNSGTATFSNVSGYLLYIGYGSVVTNQSGATWNLTTDFGITIYSGTATINNLGTFEKTAGSATSTIGVFFVNTGTLSVGAATLNFSGGDNSCTTCNGSWSAATGATLQFGGGTFNPSGSFTGAGTVAFQAGIVNLTGTYGVTGPTNINGGTVNFNQASAVTLPGPVNLSSGIMAGPATVNLIGLLSWSGGEMCALAACNAAGAGVTNANGGIAGSGNYLYVLGRMLNNSGIATFSNLPGYLLYIGYGTVVTNQAGATWNLTTDYGMQVYSGTATFNNMGTFEKTGGAVTSTIGVFFVNTGSVAANAATLVFSNGDNSCTTCNGSWAAAANAQLEFDGGTFNASGPINGAGTVNFTGGTVNMTGTYGITGTININGGTTNFNQTGAVTMPGAMNLSGGILAGPATLNITGLLTWSGGQICAIAACNAAGTGVITANGGIAASGNYLYLLGRMLNNTGTATFANLSGYDFYIGYGSVVTNQAGATWNLTTDYSIASYSGAATFTNLGMFEKTGGTASSGVSVTLNNSGTVAANAAILNMGGGGTGTGTWTVNSGATLEFNNNTFALSGPIGGTTAALGGGIVNFNGGTFNYTGTSYNISGGTLATGGTANFIAPGVITNAGPVTVTGGTLNFSTTPSGQITPNAIATPALALTGGSLAGTDTLNISGLFTWSAGQLCAVAACNAAGTGITNANGGIAASGNYLYLLGRTLNNAGIATFTNLPGYVLYEGYGATVNNKAGATWNLTTDYHLQIYSGAATFNNAGTFEKTGGTTNSTVSVTFANTGTVAADAASLSFQGSYTQTAGNTFLGGGSIQTTSANPLQIQGGTLSGTGTITGDVSNTGDNLTPGTAAAVGAITISGSGLGLYTQGAAGSYNVKIGGNGAGQFDTLTVSGTATLGGTLTVTLINAFSPVVGNSFTILNAGSVTGTFATTNLPALSAGLGWKVTYSATSVSLSVVTVSSPIATVPVGSVAFPNTIVNTSSAVNTTATVQNTGTAPLTITSIVPTGADAGNYSYALDPVKPCPISPSTLGVGISCTLDIAFAPLTAGAHNSAQISITDNSGNVSGSVQTINLSGTGIQLTTIAVTPPTPQSITQGSKISFTATGTYSDSSQQNLTTNVTWKSSNAAVASISNTSGTQGQATGLTPGSTNITAVLGAITSSPVDVLTVTAATHFSVTAPANTPEGTSFNFTVTALDASNNLVPGYTGTVHFTSSDAQAVLPANSILTNGSGLFPATLKTAGAQTITATDTVTSTITGSANITVGTGAATHYTVTAPPGATAGTSFNVTVTAFDQFNNVATGYTGTVHFTSSDAQATLPANGTLTSGVGIFAVTLKTTGPQTVTATDTVTSTITGSAGISVSTGTATHYTVTAPAGATAGTSFNVTVTALDQFNNVAAGYTGTVHFTSSDAQAILPANRTLTSGVGIFAVTLKTTGLQTVTATDTITSTITGSSNVTVSTSTATHYTVTAPAGATAGTSFNVTVTALDQFNNVATGYTGTVHFTSSDAQATLPANGTLTNGVGIFAVTLKTAGPQSVTATDTVTSTITGSANVTVSTGTATHYTVTAPAGATAGTSFNVTVTARDQFNNVATGYTGTVHFTSSDAQAALPANGTLTSGTGIFAVTLKTAGLQTVTATDTVTSTITGSANVTVSSLTTTHFALTAPAATTAGTAVNVSVTALDQFNNLVTGYTGTVHFTSSDAQAVLPANSILTNGVGNFAVTLKSTGLQSVTAADAVTSTITGSVNITVSTGTATHYAVTAPAGATAGTSFNVTVTARDQFNNVATGYTGTAHFTSSDAQATLPANGTLTSGVGIFAVTLKTAGLQSVTATDTVTSTITGSANITVSTVTATHYTVTAPAGATAGTSFNVTVAALDQFNNVATGYTGTVHFASSDAQSTLPANGMLTSGVGIFAVTLKTAGSQTVTATDTVTSAITGSANVTVSTNTATHYTLTAPAGATAGTSFNVTVTARDQFNNVATGYTGTVHFTSSDAQATLPANGTLTSGVGIFAVTLKTVGLQSVTATDTVTTTITGTASTTVSAGTPTTMAANPGTTPQTAQVNSAFANAPAVILHDTGGNPVSGVNVTFTAPNSSASGLFSNSTTTIIVPTNAAGVAAAPFTANGTAGGPYQVMAAATGLTTVSFALTNTSVGGVASASITPTSISFGSQIVSTTSSQQSINLTSNGTSAFVISSIALSGTNPGDFLETTNCPIGGAGLANGNSCGIFVSFAPTAMGARAASVVITDDQGNVVGAQQTVTLSGTGADVPVAASTTYNITGNPFTTFTGAASCSPDCNVTGSFTLAQPLAPNLSNATITPTSFSFSVGTSNLTQANTTSASFSSVSTDASGSITAWSISLSSSNFTIDTANNSATVQDFYQQTSPQGTASNANSPATWPKTVVTPVTFAASPNPVSGVATLNCPSGTSPCTDTNAHSLKLVVPAVLNGFTLTVTAFEVPPSQATGICKAGDTEATNFSCRFLTYFSLQKNPNGDVVVPLCIPYSNGNCVFYRVSNTPPSTSYAPGVLETIAWNNENFVPPAFYNGNNPRLYDDPDAAPYNLNHQFVFDITSFVTGGPGQVGVDKALHGITPQYNDFVAAFPAAPAATYVAQILSPVGTPAFIAGSNVPVNFSLTQNGTYIGSAITPPNAVAIGVVNSSGMRQPVLTAGGVVPAFTYNNALNPPQYQLMFSTTGYAPGTYTVYISSNLFPQQTQNFIVNPVPVATLQSIAVTPATPSMADGTTLQFTATGDYSDGSVQDLTGSVTWSSDTTSVATISDSGFATALTVGTATIKATSGVIVGSTLVTVSPHLYAYIGSSVSATCCLDVLDTVTNTVVTSIPVTTITEPIGVTPDQSRLYLADYNNNIVDVVDTTTNTLVTSFPVVGGPNAVAVTPNGKFGYVGNANNSTVSVFNVATNAVVANIPVGFSATWLTATPDGSRVYVTGSGNTVAVINTSTNTVSSNFNVTPPAGQPVSACLGGPTFNPSGTLGYILQLCVGSAVAGSVTVISVPSNNVVATIPVGLTPFQAVITPDGGHLYVVNGRGNNVSVIDTIANQVISTIPVGSGPQSVAVTPDGVNVYVANTVGNTLSIIKTSTNTVSSTIPLTVPFGIVIASPPPASQATTLTFKPSNLIFNPQVIGVMSAGQTINITNPGATAVTLTNVTLTGPNASEFSLTNSCPQPPATLAGGAMCPIQVFFTPFAAGPQTALLTISSTNGLANSQQSAPLSGVGTGSGATFQPTSLSFGSQTVSTTSTPQAITFTSTGDSAFVISNIAVTGANPGDFLETTNCPIGGAGLAPGSSCGIFVSFAPTAMGARAASVVITDDQGNVVGAQQTVTLSGTGADVPVVASTTYNITGNPFATFTGGASCAPDCNVTGSFTLAQPLAPNLSNATITPTSFSFSVGTSNLTQANTTSASFASISTDASGSLTSWSISLSNANFTIDTANVPGNVRDLYQQASPAGTASNSNSPATWPKTVVTPVTFAASPNPVSGVATLNCPSGTTPCTDTNAHSLKLVVPAVFTGFTLTITSFEVPPSQGNGVCEAGHTEANDFDCRFLTYFSLQKNPNGDVVVPLCIPYANGNCVFYRVSNTPPSSYYAPGVLETIAWNNESFVPPAFYNGNNPRLYDDPDAPPYNLNHQFVFDITSYVTGGPGQVGVDKALHGFTPQYNDFVAAFPAAPTATYVATILEPVNDPTFAAGSDVPVDFSLTQNGTYTSSAITPPNAVAIGVVNSAGVRQPVLTTGGVNPVFTYNAAATPPQYQLVFNTVGYAPGTYTVYISSNLFPQQTQTFTISSSTVGFGISPTPTSAVSMAKSASGNYIATVNLYNSGNVTIDSCTLISATLSAASLTSFTGGPCINIIPGQVFSLALTFPTSAGADVANVPLKLLGTYTAGKTSGNWGVSFRSVTLP
jgi:YVTN family beta-propeller protein